MAREPGITQDQVSKAAESIRESGGRPTARAIRERLGSGSMATVLKFLQVWQDTQVRPAEVPVALPAGLQRGLLEFVADEVERSRSDVLAELEIAKQTNTDLIAEAERLSLSIGNLEAALEQALVEKAGLSGRLGQVEAERDAARQDATAERQAAESARTAQAQLALRLEAMLRLEKDLNDARQAAETERQARVGAEQAAAVAAAKLEGAIEARSMMEHALAESRQREREKEQEVTMLRREIRALQSITRAKARSRAPLNPAHQAGKKG